VSVGVVPPFRGVPPQSSMRWAPARRACRAEEGAKQATSKEGMAVENAGGRGGRESTMFGLDIEEVRSSIRLVCEECKTR
jgi:hypothetical protein